MSRIVAAIVIFALTMTAAAAVPPAPAFDAETATPSVIVATSAPGESYADPEECMQKSADVVVICMHYPLWFHARLIRPVYGAQPKQEIKVITYTHYGQPEPDDATAPRMLLLLANEGRYLMPVYASARVWRRFDGRYYLLMDTPYPMNWLPCSVQTLREPISAARFPAEARLALDDFSVKKHPELFVFAKGYAFPKFGISVARLGVYLQQLQPQTKDFSCREGDR